MSHFITYLALSQPASVTTEQVVAKYRRLYGEKFCPISSEMGDNRVGQAVVALFGNMPATVMFIDQPLPENAYDPALRADQLGLWPEAKQVLSTNQAHAIVALVGDPQDHAANLRGATVVALLAGALIELLPVTAVVGTGSLTITKPDDFKSTALAIAEGATPVSIWTNMQFFRGKPNARGEDTFGMASAGLLPFIGREVELAPVAATAYEVARRAAGVFQYLIVNGPVLKDGDTVGLTNEETIRARFKPEGQRARLPIIELTVEHLDTNAPPTTFAQRMANVLKGSAAARRARG